VRRIFLLYRDAFAGLSAEVWWLSAAIFVNRSGTMVLPFLSLYLARERGVDVAAIGAYLAAYGGGAIAGIALGGRLTDRVGPKAVMFTSLAATGVMLFLIGTLVEPLAIGAALVVLAIVGEAYRPAGSAAIAAAAPAGGRARAFGMYRLALNLGMTIGPVAGGFLAEVDYAWLFRIDGATCLAAAVLLAVFVRASAPPTHAERTEAARAGRSPWRDRVFLASLGLQFLQALVFFQLQGTFMLYLNEVRGFGESLVGRLLAINTVVIVLFEMILVHRLERVSALRVVAVSGLFLGMGFGLLPYGAGVAWVGFTIALWTIGEMLAAPMMSAFVADRSEVSNRGRYMGLYAMTFSIASLVAPLVGTRVYASFGPDVLWSASLAAGVLSCAGFLALARRVERG